MALNRCPDCSKTFKRPPHLKRHLATVHSQTQSHVCPVCLKKFNRLDSFQRHFATHGGSPPGVTESAGGIRRRARSACDACSRSHFRCSGESPCARCVSNSLPCCFTNATPVRAIDSSSAGAEASSANDVMHTAPGAGTRSVDDPDDDGSQLFQPIPALAGDAAATTEQASVRRWFTSQLNWLPVLDPEQRPESSHTGRCKTSTARGTDLSSQDTLSPIVNAQSPSAITSSYQAPSISQGSLCIHGQGSRESQQQRSFRPGSNLEDLLLKSSAPKQRDDGSTVFGFTGLGGAIEYASHIPSPEVISPSTYSTICSMFSILAGGDRSYFRTFETSYFPPLRYLNVCFSLFIENASKDLPIIHASYWEDEGIPWLLALAACTVGSISHPCSGQNQAAYSLQEFLRRAIAYEVESSPESDTLVLCEVALFNAFTAVNLYSALSNATQAAFKELELLKSRLSEEAQQSLLGGLESVSQCSRPSWATWIKQESIRRLMFYSWQLTFYWSITGAWCQCVEPSQLPIPCTKALWDANSEETWSSLHKKSSRSLLMREVLHSLFIRREIPNGLDGCCLVASIYGVLNRTLQVGHQLRHPLGQWKPASNPDQDIFNQDFVEQAGWLPANSTFASWRNSACDCLDLMHWRTHVEVAANAGRETPPILHLHLARLILLTPLQEVVEFAFHAAKSYNSGKGHISINPSSPTTGVSCPPHVRTAVWRWLTLDDYKGRLSIIHAGASFWYCRRFALTSVYEPLTIFLATLLLWVYALYQPQVRSVLVANKLALEQLRSNSRGHSVRTEDLGTTATTTDNDDPTRILVDRPCDDEMVQIFIQKGLDIEPCMFGDTQICVGRGWLKVLQEGIKLIFHCRQSSYAKACEYQSLLLTLTKNIDK